MMVPTKVGFGDHERISKTAKMRCIFDLLGENVRRINSAGDMEDGSLFGFLDDLTSLCFAQVYVCVTDATI